MKLHIIFFFFTISFILELVPCSRPSPGYYFDKDKIITDSSTILLITVSNNKMKVKEVLKGDLDLFDLFIFNSYSDWFGTISFGEFDMKHNYDNHFNDKVFWDKNIGRSPFPCCVCAPLHKFSNEKEYLLFPDMLGAMKSAELIRNKNDKWYLYVKEKVNKK